MRVLGVPCVLTHLAVVPMLRALLRPPHASHHACLLVARDIVIQEGREGHPAAESQHREAGEGGEEGEAGVAAQHHVRGADECAGRAARRAKRQLLAPNTKLLAPHATFPLESKKVGGPHHRQVRDEDAIRSLLSRHR